MSSSPSLPSHAHVVIIGGGIVGLSVAYHLTKHGWHDVVLLERQKLTSGTTWHAAGLVGQLRATHNLTRLAKYTAELFSILELETGVATGFKQRGSLAIAATEGRWEELRRGASMARHFGLDAHLLTPREARERWPLLHVDDVVGGLFIPKDGQTNPVDTAMALARGARSGGVRIHEGVTVTGILKKNGRAAGVRTQHGDIATEIVVNCAGLWGHQVGEMAGVAVPLHAAEHFYVVTEPIAGLSPDTPVLRDPDGANYFKEDAGKLLVGWFEPVSRPWDHRAAPDDFAFGTLPVDMDHIAPQLEKAAHRVPRFGEAGIRTFFNGPESFTPDDRYLLGEAPELPGFFVASGFNSIGIQSSGGAGKVLADWIVHGHPPMDLWDVDIRRVMPFQRNRAYLRERTVETLGLLYAMHWPYRQVETARGARRSPLHDRLTVMGACFGETAGWERANWFAPPDMVPEYEYSYGRQNWFGPSGEEHRAARESVALFDQTSFGKFMVQGVDAEAVLNRICANDIAVEPGRVVYTQWLNERGGIEADVTVTRLSATEFLVVTSAACQTRDLVWLRRHTPTGSRCTVTDITSGQVVLGVMGPRSRELMAALSPDEDFSAKGFGFMTSREVDIAYARVRASRLTYVGALGWELYIPAEFAAGVFDAVLEAGERFGLRLAGYHAMNSLRLECGYRHFGHDITDETSPLEAGLGFAVAWDKPGGFIGREALLPARGQRLKRRLVALVLDDPQPLLLHDEPIWRDGERAGIVASGMFGHTVGRSVGLGYVGHDGGVDAAWLAAGKWEVEIACERFPCRVSLAAPVDSKAVRA
ncbi:MAG: FAD-dependent oxidoreductase [Alphaproteobacteria bacterium]|nr:FAD-dependent oxidoreductase [Alphaproteobacteria bacterium]